MNINAIILAFLQAFLAWLTWFGQHWIKAASILVVGSLMGQQVSYPPKPGERPDYPLLVGPAASVYKQLEADAGKLPIAQAQLAAALASLSLHAYRAQDAISNAQLVQLEARVNQAVATMRDVVTNAIKKAGKDPATCKMTETQDIKCPDQPPPEQPPAPPAAETEKKVP